MEFESILCVLLGVIGLIMGVAILVLKVKIHYKQKKIQHQEMIIESLKEMKKEMEKEVELQAQLQVELKQDCENKKQKLLDSKGQLATLNLIKAKLKENLVKTTQKLEAVSEEKLELESRNLSLKEKIEILRSDINSAKLAKTKRQTLKPILWTKAPKI